MELNPQKRLNCKEALSHPWYVLSSRYHSIIHCSTSLLYLYICYNMCSCESIYSPMHTMILSIYWSIHPSIHSSIHLSIHSSIHLSLYSFILLTGSVLMLHVMLIFMNLLALRWRKVLPKQNGRLIFHHSLIIEFYVINISRYITRLTIILLYIKSVYYIIVCNLLLILDFKTHYYRHTFFLFRKRF